MKILGSITELVTAIFRTAGGQITLKPNSSVAVTASRDVELPPGDVNQVIVSANSTQTLTNKTLTSPAITTPTGIVKADVGLSNVDNTSDVNKPVSTAQGLADTAVQNFSIARANHTGTQAAGTITGLAAVATSGLKADVGLGNVDNTSDAAKNSAGATLTNKTLTSPVINTATITDSPIIFATAGATSAELQTPRVTTAQKNALATPATGRVVFDTTLNSLFVYNGTAWAPAGGGAALKSTITQASHVFVAADLGSPLYLVGTVYTSAKADAANTAEVVAHLDSIIDGNTISVTMSGEVTVDTAVSGGAMVAGTVYYVSAATAGLITATEPSTIGQVSKPVGVAKSTTVLVVIPMRGVVVGGTNALTTIAFANTATSTIQDVAAYQGGELSGYVSISATTSSKFFIKAQFSKNAAGTDFNLSYQVSGETPPASFVMSVTSAGLIQITIGTLAGFTSASITYGLNVAAVGATFPLSISARNVIGDVSGTAVPVNYIGQVIENSSTTMNSLASTVQQVATITLTPGVWLACAYGQWGGDSTARFMQLYIGTTANSSAGTSGTAGTSSLGAGWNGTGGVGTASLNPVPLYVTTTTVYYLNAYVSSISGLSDQRNRLQAVRIA